MEDLIFLKEIWHILLARLFVTLTAIPDVMGSIPTQEQHLSADNEFSFRVVVKFIYLCMF